MSAITLVGVVDGEEKPSFIEPRYLHVRSLLDFLKEIYPRVDLSCIEMKFNYRRINFLLVEQCEDLNEMTLHEMARLKDKEGVPFDRMKTFRHYLQYVHECYKDVPYKDIKFILPLKYL